MNESIVVLLPRKLIKPPRGKTTFKCITEGAVFWMFGEGRKLPSNTDTGKKGNLTNWLSIYDINYYNSNTYTCWIKKDFLQIYSTAELIVITSECFYQ